MAKIDFLYWEDCPSYRNALDRLKEILNQTGIQAQVNLIEINTEEEARRFGFPGSPTIRVDGKDIDPKGSKKQRVGLSCRIYHDETKKVTPLPPEGMIRNALEAGLKKDRKS